MEKPDSHPAFQQPESAQTVLWRYLDAWKFEWLVKEKRLLMARADQLGDPLEGTSPDGHRRWWQEQLEKAASDDDARSCAATRSFWRPFAIRIM